MSTIIERIRHRRQQEFTGLWKRYAELLSLDPADDPALVEEMIEVCERLDREPADMEHDRRVLQQVRHCRERIANGAGLDDAYDRAHKALERFLVAKEKALQQLREKHHELENRLSGIGGRRSSGYDAIHELNRLKERHPELLASEPEAREEDLLAPPVKR